MSSQRKKLRDVAAMEARLLVLQRSYLENRSANERLALAARAEYLQLHRQWLAERNQIKMF